MRWREQVIVDFKLMPERASEKQLNK